MNNSTYLAALVTPILIATATIATAETVYPSDGSSDWYIPNGSSNMTAQIKDGGWADKVHLPATASNGDIITVLVTSGWSTNLDLSNTDVPMANMEMYRGQSIKFVYDSSMGKWKFANNPQYPVNGSSRTTVSLQTGITHFSVKNGGWTSQIYLPNNAQDNQLVVLSSTAAYSTKVNTDNLLFDSNYKLKNGQSYWFRYSSKLGKWVPEGIQPSITNITSSWLPTPPTAVSQFIFQNDVVSQVTLPYTAKDRDRVIITSNTNSQKTIKNYYLATDATLKLNHGDRYEFMYVADRGHWVLMSSPRTYYQAGQLSSGYVPNIRTPITEINASNGNHAPNIYLPNYANIDDKVIVRSTATWSLNVRANNGLVRQVKTDENVRFVYTNTGWQVATNTIDMLLVNSPEVDRVLGSSAAKIRLLEGIHLTNITAENSDANFYIRPVGYLTHKIYASSLADAIVNGRDDQTIQNERVRLSADGVYYQGNEPDGACGKAWINTHLSPYDMLAVSNLGCGTSVVRHEIGHNLGLNHDNSGTIGQGFSHPLGSTTMSGDDLLFYSSPNLYNPAYGVRLGKENSIDAVYVINNNTATIANFY